MTREELIEKMARAAYPIVFDPAKYGFDPDGPWQSQKETALSNAEAALKAIDQAGLSIVPNEPNDEIKDALFQSVIDRDFYRKENWTVSELHKAIIKVGAL